MISWVVSTVFVNHTRTAMNLNAHKRIDRNVTLQSEYILSLDSSQNRNREVLAWIVAECPAI